MKRMTFYAKVLKILIEFEIIKLNIQGLTVYMDMDNTLALWCKKGESKMSLEQSYEKGFFRNLPVMDDCQLSIPNLQMLGIRVKLASACVESPYCEEDKIGWIEEFLPTIDTKKDVILCKMGENKARYADDISKSILVDDYGKNLKDWMEAGGIAIKKSSSNKKRSIPVVRNHMDIFKVLFKLNYLKFSLKGVVDLFLHVAYEGETIVIGNKHFW